ncbi:MAG: ScbA/BarX family gamma-butyrolactone biosynthesis protein [Streptomyces sp.]
MTVIPALPPLPPLPEDTGYSAPVPRELVHKAAHSEVLLTGWRQCGGAEFEVGAQWPRDHGFWRTGSDGEQDPMLLVETTRQVLPLLSHAAFGVPTGHQLIWDHYQCRFAAPFIQVSDRPAEVTVRLVASQAPGRARRLRKLSLRMTLSSAGRTLGTASTLFSAHSPEVYARLRGPNTREPEAVTAAVPRPPAPVAPALVGRESEREVVLAPAAEPGSWQLRILTSSPWLFDHPVDHAPGMLLMEAARQGARLAEPGQQLRLTCLAAEFHRYVDLDAPSLVRAFPAPAAPDGERRLKVTLTQHGQEAFAATVGIAADVRDTARLR